MKKSPILLIVFNRFDTASMVFESIRQYKPDNLYIASDGARANVKDEIEIVQSIREYIINNINWECNINTFFRDQNVGCGRGPSEAITWFFKHEEMGIILEDDCLPSLPFYDFCTQMLDKYKNIQNIWMISGRSHYSSHKIFKSYDYIFSKNCITWGWATWRSSWNKFELELKNWDEFYIQGGFKNLYFSIFEGVFMNYIFKKQITEIEYKAHVWDFQFVFSILSNNGLSIIPSKNLIENIGYQGTHFSGKTKLQLLKAENNYSVKKEPVFILPNRLYENFYFRNTLITKVQNVILNFIRRIFKK